MEIDYCSYHYSSPATWHCQKCNLFYGNCCFDSKNSNLKSFRCPLCRDDLFSLGAANTVEPFWNGIHRFLAYPFKLRALILIVLLSFLSGLAVGNILGISIIIFVILAGTRYAYAIIENASMGKMSPPSLSNLITSDPDRLFLKQIVVFIIAGAFVAATSATGNWFLSLLSVAFITVAMPASILVLAIQKRIADAVNPILLTQLMIKMGTGYLVLYVFVNILTSGPYYVLNYFSNWISKSWYIELFVGSTLYFTYAAAFMMGYALLQYQKELGYRAEIESEGDNSIDENYAPGKESVNDAYILLIEGRYHDAYDILKRAAHAYPQDIELQLRFNGLMAEMGRQDALTEHSEILIEKLCLSNSVTKAAQVFINTIKTIPEFKLSSAESLFALSEHFHMRGQHKNALALLSQIIKQHPTFHDIGYVYLRAARIYAEHLNLPIKAKKIIDHILNQGGYTDAIKTEASKLARAISQ